MPSDMVLPLCYRAVLCLQCSAGYRKGSLNTAQLPAPSTTHPDPFTADITGGREVTVCTGCNWKIRQKRQKKNIKNVRNIAKQETKN